MNVNVAVTIVNHGDSFAMSESSVIITNSNGLALESFMCEIGIVFILMVKYANIIVLMGKKNYTLKHTYFNT